MPSAMTRAEPAKGGGSAVKGKFSEQIVWITGGGSGLGREMAKEFAREGAHVVVSGRRIENLDETCEEIMREGYDATAMPCDVRDENAVEKVVQDILSMFGALHVVVANAGYSVAGAIETISADVWRDQLETNVVGLTNTARSALPALRESKGRLVLLGSVAGLVSMPGTGPYHASKFAVRSIGETLAMELYGSGVSCTTIHPGFVASQIGRVDNRGRYDETRKDPRPAKLMWSPDDAARVMVRAIYRRKREFVFTGHGKVAGFLGRHFPGLVHFAITRGGLGYKRG